MNFNCPFIFLLGLARLGKGNIWRTEQCGQLDLQDYDAHSVASSVSEVPGHAYRRPLQGQWCVMCNSRVTIIEWSPYVVPAHDTCTPSTLEHHHPQYTDTCIKTLYNFPNIYISLYYMYSFFFFKYSFLSLF